MRYLLDTHIVLWFLNEPEKIPAAVFGTILDSVNEKYISIASAWELAIKIRTKKLVFDGGVEQFFHSVTENCIGLLPITEQHVKQVESLPLLHRDPFDRILVASAMIENMCLITSDTNIHLYDVNYFW